MWGRRVSGVSHANPCEEGVFHGWVSHDIHHKGRDPRIPNPKFRDRLARPYLWRTKLVMMVMHVWEEHDSREPVCSPTQRVYTPTRFDVVWRGNSHEGVGEFIGTQSRSSTQRGYTPTRFDVVWCGNSHEGGRWVYRDSVTLLNSRAREPAFPNLFGSSLSTPIHRLTFGVSRIWHVLNVEHAPAT